MRTRSPELLLAVVAALACAGCPSLAQHQTPETVAPGKWQLAVSGGGSLYRDTQQQATTPAPAAEIALRRGLARDLDAQASAYLWGLDAGVKYRFLDGAWSAAIAPRLGFSRFVTTTSTVDSLYVWGHLPMIFGRRLGPSLTLVFGPRMLYGMYAPATGGRAHGLGFGGFAGFEVRLTSRFRLLPEVSILRSSGGEVPVRGWYGYFGPGLLVDL